MNNQIAPPEPAKQAAPENSIDSYFTAAEIKARNKYLPWRPQQIGWLGTLGLIRKRKFENFTLFYETDVIELHALRGLLSS